MKVKVIQIPKRKKKKVILLLHKEMRQDWGEYRKDTNRHGENESHTY